MRRPYTRPTRSASSFPVAAPSTTRSATRPGSFRHDPGGFSEPDREVRLAVRLASLAAVDPANRLHGGSSRAVRRPTSTADAQRARVDAERVLVGGDLARLVERAEGED